MAHAYGFIAVGVFTLVCALSEFGWFWNHRKAQSLMKLIGKGGCRIFYTLIGTIFLVAGIGMLMGWIVAPS